MGWGAGASKAGIKELRSTAPGHRELGVKTAGALEKARVLVA